MASLFAVAKVNGVAQASNLRHVGQNRPAQGLNMARLMKFEKLHFMFVMFCQIIYH